MKEAESLPDHLRCRRNDGRQWRCTRHAMQNKSFCNLHSFQARLRQNKQKVPDDMKLQRGPKSPRITTISSPKKKTSEPLPDSSPKKKALEALPDSSPKKKALEALPDSSPKKKALEVLPDDLRCRRNDGHSWRCGRRAMKNRTLCKLHCIQARCRQKKQKVPEDMKLQRGPRSRGSAISSPRKKALEDLPDHLRCRRNDGHSWRCGRGAMKNRSFCKLHYIQARCRQKKEKVPEDMKLQRGPKSRRAIVISSAQKKALEALPDDLRCRRSSQNWRCKRRAVKNRSLCKIHCFQEQCWQNKQKVPDDMKLQRGPKPKKELKRRSGLGFQDKAGKKMKIMKGDLEMELIEMVLQWQMERKKRRISEKNEGELKDLPNGRHSKKKKNGGESNDVPNGRLSEKKNEGELKDLPNGRMAISPAPVVVEFGNAIKPCERKVGLEADSFIGRRIRSKNAESVSKNAEPVLPVSKNVEPVLPVSKNAEPVLPVSKNAEPVPPMSKNAEPVPMSSSQIVPYGRNKVGSRRILKKKCHQCQHSCAATCV
ncbi:uncharacterized protein LOC143892996 [Tasmannia lanceolata]|uniref:uncharacterized protein LOC143892996 n=1 Tax=Tasmannia lanceolata TaxID=3420 RepID=UPI0040632FBA